MNHVITTGAPEEVITTSRSVQSADDVVTSMFGRSNYGSKSRSPPRFWGRGPLFIIIIIIIYLLKSTEQEDLHMINTRTRAGQERQTYKRHHQ